MSNEDLDMRIIRDTFLLKVGLFEKLESFITDCFDLDETKKVDYNHGNKYVIEQTQAIGMFNEFIAMNTELSINTIEAILEANNLYDFKHYVEEALQTHVTCKCTLIIFDDVISVCKSLLILLFDAMSNIVDKNK